MIGAPITPTRGGEENHQGVLTDASSRINWQATNSFNKEPSYQHQYLSPDSFTTPDCKDFNLDYYFESSKTSQCAHRRLRRDASTRTLRSLARYHQTRGHRSPYDTSPYTPSKLSKVMVAEYEFFSDNIDTDNIDTPSLTMPTRLSLNKKLPPKPIFRLGNSPERRGLLDATDLNSSSLQFPILEPESAVKESSTNSSSVASVPQSSSNPFSVVSVSQDLKFVIAPSISHNSDDDSEFEVGIAQIGTAYGTSTNSQLPTPPTDEIMPVLKVRDTNASIKRQKFNNEKLGRKPETDKSKGYDLKVPSGNDRLTSENHIASLQNDGSPLPKIQRRARSGLGNGEDSSSTKIVISRFSNHGEQSCTELDTNETSFEPLIQVDDNADNSTDDPIKDEIHSPIQDIAEENSITAIAEIGTDSADHVDNQEDSAQEAVEDVITNNPIQAGTQDAGQDATEDITANATAQNNINQSPVNHVVQAVARNGPMGRSDSQTTLGRRKKLGVYPSKRFARDADRTILGSSPPYDKVTARGYMEEPTKKGRPSFMKSQKLARKVSTTKPKGIKGVLAARVSGSTAPTKVTRRKSSLPDSPENKALRPSSLTVEKQLSFTERLTKPTASSAARAKARQSVPLAKSTTMASVKNAGRGLKSRLSGMMRSRRSSEVVPVIDPAVRSSDSNFTDTTAQNSGPTVILDQVSEIDVGEEFASIYNEITYPTEQVGPAAAVDPHANKLNGGSKLADSGVAETSYQMVSHPSRTVTVTSETQVDDNSGNQNAPLSEFVLTDREQTLNLLTAPTRAPPAPPQNFPQIQGHSGIGAQIASGNGASDPPPNEDGNSGHANEQPNPPSNEEMFEEIKITLDHLRDALRAERDPAEHEVLRQLCEHFTLRIQAINNMRQTLERMKQAEETAILNASIDSLQARRALADRVSRPRQ